MNDGDSVLVAHHATRAECDLEFNKYKQQGYSERANHEFKTPLAIHPLFLKSPRRVEALVFLMMMALTAYPQNHRQRRRIVPPIRQQQGTKTALRAKRFRVPRAVL